MKIYVYIYIICCIENGDIMENVWKMDPLNPLLKMYIFRIEKWGCYCSQLCYFTKGYHPSSSYPP